MEGIHRPLMVAFQGLILVFAALLIYFIAVYYPSALNRASLGIAFEPFTNDKVVVSTGDFPVVTDSYRITYAGDSNVYYVFVEGAVLTEFIENKLAAQLSLKNILSLESLCNLKVIYVSSADLELEAQYLRTAGCD